MHIFKHCREVTLFLLWIGTYCISCVVQQTSGVKDLSSLVRYDDSSLAAIRHVQSIIPVVRPRPNIRSHSVLLLLFLISRWTWFLFYCLPFTGKKSYAKKQPLSTLLYLTQVWICVYFLVFLQLCFDFEARVWLVIR